MKNIIGRKKLWLAGLVLIGLVVVLLGWICWGKRPLLSPKGEGDFNVYSTWYQYRFDELGRREFEEGEISLGEVQSQSRYGEVRKFYFTVSGKKVSGLAHIPLGKGFFPAVLMVRGYAERQGYYSGSGTDKVAEKLVEKGILTLAPDFLGYGESEAESEDMLEARFAKAETVLALLYSLKSLEMVDLDRVGLWGHSNGGQIILSVLEISGLRLPTVLWAPVSKGFPEGVLVYADDLDDGGEAVRGAIEEFEKREDTRFFSIDYWWERVRAAVLVLQGTADKWVETEWSEELVKNLQETGGEARLVKYEGADHNLKQNWSEAVEETLEFYEREKI